MAETMTIRAAARVLGVHENTVRHWVDEGRLAAQVLPGSGFRRPYTSAVLALVEQVEDADADALAEHLDTLAQRLEERSRVLRQTAEILRHEEES